jgi:hypothetical protein
MLKYWVKRSALAASIIGALAAGAARAQDTPQADAPPAAAAAPEKAARHPKMVKPKAAGLPIVDVVVTNHRSVGLVELNATMEDGLDTVKIAGPLAANKKIVAHIAHDKTCLFNLKGSFADGADMASEAVDLCKDKKIDLLD